MRVDIQAYYDRDPACDRFLMPVLYFKGFHAIQTHRLAHWLWNARPQGFRALPAEPLVVGVPDRHQPGRADRQGHLHRPRHRPRGRRDRRHRGRRLDPARRDARRHRQGRRRPSPEDPLRRADRRRAPRSSAISRSAIAPRSRPVRWCCRRCRTTRRWPACRRASSAKPAATSRRARWTSSCRRRRWTTSSASTSERRSLFSPCAEAERLRFGAG